MATRRDEQWAKYEELGHKIFSDLMPHADVKLDDHIPGVESETDRQIDVSARWSDEGQSYLLIVQIRDRRKPADVNTIGEFKSVIQDVGANKGVLICSGGFSKKAITYARNVGISLYSLHDAASTDWRTELTVPLVWINLVPEMWTSFEVYLDTSDTIHRDPSTGLWKVSQDGGRTAANLLEIFKEKWNAGSLDRGIDGPHAMDWDEPVSVYITNPDDSRPRWKPVKNFAITYTVRRDAWLGQYRPNDCRGLVDMLNDQSFIPSYMNITDIPMSRDPSWPKITDPDQLAIKAKGLIITTEGYEIVAKGPEFTKAQVRYLGP